MAVTAVSRLHPCPICGQSKWCGRACKYSPDKAGKPKAEVVRLADATPADMSEVYELRAHVDGLLFQLKVADAEITKQKLEIAKLTTELIPHRMAPAKPADSVDSIPAAEVGGMLAKLKEANARLEAENVELNSGNMMLRFQIGEMKRDAAVEKAAKKPVRGVRS